MKFVPLLLMLLAACSNLDANSSEHNFIDGVGSELQLRNINLKRNALIETWKGKCVEKGLSVGTNEFSRCMLEQQETTKDDTFSPQR